MTPLTVKLLTPHREGCPANSYILGTNVNAWPVMICNFRTCEARIELDEESLDRVITEALEEQG